MAEALGVAASVLTLIETSKKILQFGLASPILRSTEVQEFEIYGSILSEVGRQSLSMLGELPDAAAMSLRLCQEHIMQIRTLVSTKDAFPIGKSHFRHKEAKRAVRDFGNSVKILREIVMDATTHTLLQDQHRQFSELLKQVSTQINDLKMHSQSSDESRNPTNQRPQEGLKDAAAQLQANMERYTSRDRLWRQESHDPFSFEAAIIHPHIQESGRSLVHAKLDTGCEDDWIALEILERASMINQVIDLDVTVSYVAFGGQTFEALGTVDLTWYPTNSGKSRQSRFLVHREVPFDMVLGRRSILEEGGSFFERPAMALRMGQLTKEEHRLIEENTRKKGATKSQLSEIRRANDATARDRLRQEKAASLAATPASSYSHNQSVVSPSTSHLHTPSQSLGQDINASSLQVPEASQPIPYEEAIETDRM